MPDINLRIIQHRYMAEQGEDALAGAVGHDARRIGTMQTHPVPISSFQNEYDLREHAILDACDGEGLMVSPKDPSTFFLDDDDDGPAIGLGNSFEDTKYLDIENDEDDYARDDFISREFSGGFPPIPEDSEYGTGVVPDDFGREQLSMAQMPFLGDQDDFAIGFNALKNQPRKSSKGFHKVASMPNFSMENSLIEDDEGQVKASAASLLPKSFSTNDLSSLSSQKYDVPHSQFLTAPHMRKGKGGRQPKIDPRMDPNIDPKKARRILANRLSAAKSKLKQKTALDKLKQRIQGLEAKKESLEQEIMMMRTKSAEEVEKRSHLQDILKQLQTSKQMIY